MTCITQKDSRFLSLGHAKRIWTISAIHGDIDRLVTLHDTIYPQVNPGDRIVYTGNYIGHGAHSAEVVDEILTFRRAVLAKPAMIPSDLVYLRGAQEEMWQKLWQLQFAPDPMNTFLWMLDNGLHGTLESYGLCPSEGIESCRQGMVGITHWTRKIRRLLQEKTGHHQFAMHLVRAAYCAPGSPHPMLFVNAGIDISRPLERQGDSFWWAHAKFDQITIPYHPYKKVIRGFDPMHKGPEYNDVKATIDAGCGFGGDLLCALFSQDGVIVDSARC